MEVLSTTIKIKPLIEGVQLPEKATVNSAGFDIRAAESLIIPPGEYKSVATGFSIEMPSNMEAQIRPRSGLALKSGVTILNAPGTIDADYRGEVKIILINHSKTNFHIEKGDRVAQMIFSKVVDVTIQVTDSLSETTRGDGGFGSTGKHKII